MLWNIFIYIVVYLGLFTGIFFLFTFFENLNYLREVKPKRFPKVSIIVPAYNEENTLKGTLYSLLNLDYPKDKIEIIVVDDGSKDNTFEIAKSFENRNVKVFTKPNGGKAHALNYGLAKCIGELVGCLDADSFVQSNSLKKMIGYFEDENIMAVTPSIKIWKDSNLLQKIQRIEYLMGVFLRKVFSYLDSIHVTPGPFTIYRKKFFDKYGGYDEGNLTEDIEVALRIQRYGFRIENCMDANVYTIGPSTLKSLQRQRNRWYVGFLENVLNYKDLFGLKHGNLGVFILPSAFISVGFSIIIFFFTIGRWIVDLTDQILNLYSVHFDIFPFFNNIQLNARYVNLGSLKMLFLFSLLLGLSMVIISKIYSKENYKLSLSYVAYISAYWLFFAFWWVIAIGLKLFKRRVTW